MYRLQCKNNPDRGVWLVGDKITLGASRENNLVLNSSGIELLHAHILISPEHILLKSLGAICYVNNIPITSHCILQGGDEIRIGTQQLVLLDSQRLDEVMQVESAERATEEAKEVTTNWSIISDHPKLKAKKFLISKQAVLGRSKECDFVVFYKVLSRKHAEFIIDESGLLLTDLDSFNGTFVNGKRIKKARLKSGDIVSFANLAFTVQSPSHWTKEPKGENK